MGISVGIDPPEMFGRLLPGVFQSSWFQGCSWARHFRTTPSRTVLKSHSRFLLPWFPTLVLLACDTHLCHTLNYPKNCNEGGLLCSILGDLLLFLKAPQASCESRFHQADDLPRLLNEAAALQSDDRCHKDYRSSQSRFGHNVLDQLVIQDNTDARLSVTQQPESCRQTTKEESQGAALMI